MSVALTSFIPSHNCSCFICISAFPLLVCVLLHSGQIIVFIDCEMVDERMKEGAGAEPLPTDTVTASTVGGAF